VGDHRGSARGQVGVSLRRTDNGVKNHFFAKLRKSMRRINKIIQERFKKRVKELKLNVLYKIVEASEERFKKTPLCSEETSKNSCRTSRPTQSSKIRSSASPSTPPTNYPLKTFSHSSAASTTSARTTSASPSSLGASPTRTRP